MTTTDELSTLHRQIEIGDQVVEHYTALCGSQDNQTTLADLLASLMHWANWYALDFDSALGEAEYHFDEELAEAELARLMGDRPYSFTVGEARKTVEALKLQRRTGIVNGKVVSVWTHEAPRRRWRVTRRAVAWAVFAVVVTAYVAVTIL